jgi:hypothetical protein
MSPDAIAAITAHVPGAVELIDPDLGWPEGIVAVPEEDPLAGELDDALFWNPPDEGLTGALPASPDAPDASPGTRDLFDPIDDGDEGGIPEDRASLVERLRGHFGAGWPGAPGGAAPAGDPRTQMPNPDAYGFYLPWHRFSPKIWGIYLVFQGIEELGELIQRHAPPLSRSEARRAARLFIFLHEAYHNAVETFAARLEVSHRRPSYLPGVIGAYRQLLQQTGLHEEGLASAYAVARVREKLFLDMKVPPANTAAKRAAAAGALRDLLGQYQPPYNTATWVLDRLVDFDDAERELQETCHQLSPFSVPSTPRDLWAAGSRLMTPSLSRNKRFSYLIDRNHPIVRHAALVPRLQRREVIRRLRAATGGTEAGGGKHPKFVLPGGHPVPVPGHAELERGTTRNILKQAGIDMPLSVFMQADDDELRRAVRQ